MTRFVRALLPLVLLAVLAGCGPIGLDFRPFAGGLLSDKPCAPPCWQNLVPGQTSEEEVNSFVAGLTAEEREALRDAGDSADCRRIEWEVRTVQMEDGRLSLIKTFIDQVLSVQQVIDHFGSPEYYEALHLLGPDINGSSYIIWLFYPARGLAFEVHPDRDLEGRLEAADQVRRVHYFVPGDLAAYLKTEIRCGTTDQGAQRWAEIRLSRIKPWTAFGEIEAVEIK